MKVRNKKLRIGLKLNRLDGIIIGLVSFLLIFAMVLFRLYTYNVEHSQQELIQQVVTRMSENQKTQVTKYLDEKMTVLKGLTGYKQVSGMDVEEQREFLKSKSKKFGFFSFFVVDANGVGNYVDEGVLRDQSKEQFFFDIINNETFITEPYYTGIGPAITTMSVPIYKGDKKAGVLCGTLSLSSIQSIVKKYEMVLDGGCFMLNQDGKVISSNEFVKLDINSQASVYNMPDSDLSLVQEAFANKTDTSGSVTISGVEYLSHVAYLEGVNWVIVQSIPQKVIVERFMFIQFLQYVLLGLILALFACVVRIIFSWKKSDKKIYTDILTGCNSRAACLSLLESLEDQHNMRISVVYMDLNKFKFVNDTYGHDKGDKLLRIFGGVLNKVFGTVGFVGRMGGDEFIAILADVNDSEIVQYCKEVEELLWEKSKTLDFPYVISSSYGYASRNVGRDETLDEILQYADERMYANKAKKKNEK